KGLAGVHAPAPGTMSSLLGVLTNVPQNHRIVRRFMFLRWFPRGGARRSVSLATRVVLVAIACALVVPEVQAQDARGYRSTEWPWNLRGYQSYAPAIKPPSIPPPPPQMAPTPRRYTVHISVLPLKYEEAPESALVVAHLPEDARIWFEDQPTQQTGTL